MRRYIMLLALFVLALLAGCLGGSGPKDAASISDAKSETVSGVEAKQVPDKVEMFVVETEDEEYLCFYISSSGGHSMSTGLSCDRLNVGE